MDSTFKYILCRLCLCESASLMDIFEETYEQGFVISEVIEDLLHFKVMKLRGLPWLVCTRCLEKLKEFRLFKMQCIDSKVAFESRFLVDGKHAINDQVEIRRVRKEDLEPDHDRVSYPQVEVSRVKIEKGETEIDQEFYPQVILETVEEGEVEDCMGAINTVLPKVMRSEDSLYAKGGFQASVVQRVQAGLNCGPMPPDKHYHCSSCGKSFVKSSHLTRHIRTHTNDRPYACELCGKRYIENSDLTSHMMSHTGEKPFSCPHCGKGFYRNSHLNRHINTHRTSKARAQAVLLDAAEILGGGGVKTEDLRLDGDEEPLVSSLRENLERYEAKGLHFMGSLLEGRGCPPYPGTNRLDQQRLSWLRDGRSLLHPNGGSVEVKQEPLDMSSHEQSLECSMGDDGSEGIIGVGGLRDDEENKTFLCSFCGKGFSKNSQLLRHTRTHTDDRPFVCETCGRRYIEASDLNQHIKVHSGVKPHRCGQCGKGFMKNSHLKRHRITHTNERPYTCKVCRKGFIESSDLNRHMVVHSKDGTVGMGVDGHSGGGGGGREYGCNLCGKAFSFKSNLVTHMRTHSGSKPFVCEHCGKGFAQNGNLITHRRVHTGERPYVCRLCNKGFSQKSTLNHHIKTH